MPQRLSTQDKREVDAVCDRFEAACRAGPPPAIASFLDFIGLKRARLFVELVQIELHYARSRGSAASFADYRARFPQYALLVEELDQSGTVVGEPGPAPDGDAEPVWRLVGAANPAECYTLPPDVPCTIGRRIGLTIRLVADRMVSAEHARIEPAPAGRRIVDLESKNGTFVNGNRIAEALLAPNDLVRFGRTEFWVQKVG